MAPATRPPVQLSAVTIRKERSRASSTSRRARVTISRENISAPLAGSDGGWTRASDSPMIQGDSRTWSLAYDDLRAPSLAPCFSPCGALRRYSLRKRSLGLPGRADGGQAGLAEVGGQPFGLEHQSRLLPGRSACWLRLRPRLAATGLSARPSHCSRRGAFVGRRRLAASDQ